MTVPVVISQPSRAKRVARLSQIAEVCQHSAVYAGVPAANHAFMVAAPVLEELRAEEA